MLWCCCGHAPDTPETIEDVLQQAAGMKVGSFCVTVPVEVMKALGQPDVLADVGRSRGGTLRVPSGPQGHAHRSELIRPHDPESEELALNVNTIGDLWRAEMLLSRRLAHQGVAAQVR